MTSEIANNPASVGLAGDGDEISAIYDVEKEFGIKFNYDDAPDWLTAGDLFNSLLAELPSLDSTDRQTWDRFAIAVSRETGVDPNLLTPESPLILQGHPWRQIHDLLGWAWLLVLALIGIVLIIAIIE